MKKDFNVKGNKESATPAAGDARRRAFSVRTFVNADNKNHRTATDNADTLSKSVAFLKMEHLPAQSRRKRIYELFFPVLIVSLLGSIAFAMGRHMGRTASEPARAPYSVLKAAATAVQKIPAARILAGQGTSERITIPDETASEPVAAREQAPRVHTVSPEEKAAWFRNNWKKYMTVANSNYKRRLLGGIRGLSITFNNNTDYPVEEVVVAVTYIKANNKVWKTKLIPLSNIAPHTAKSQEIERARRGRSVRISIQKVTASTLQLHYAAH